MEQEQFDALEYYYNRTYVELKYEIPSLNRHTQFIIIVLM